MNEVSSETEFYRGARFRKYNIGMNNVSEEDDYYEYMLVDDGALHMLLVNTSTEAGSSKAGNVVCYVKNCRMSIGQ